MSIATHSGQVRAPTASAHAVPFPLLIGSAAFVMSVLYLLSDVVEFFQGGFSTFQLSLTYVSEAAIPLFVLGLYGVQLPRIGWVGLVGAVTYAYAFVFFSSTVVFALVRGTPDWQALTSVMGVWITIHGAAMVLGGVAFGYAVVKAGVLPRWTGITLMVGVVLVALASGLPDAVQLMAAGVRDLAFAGMGVALLRPPGRPGMPSF